MPTDSFDAVFVGSGFGAAVTACRLAPHIGSSCMLERGREYAPQDFPRVKLPAYLTDVPELTTSQRLPEAGRLLWEIDQGLFDVRNLGQLRVIQAAGFGGGSLIYANVQLRPPADVFRSWPEEYQNGALDRYFDTVVKELDAKPLPEKRRRQTPKAELMRRAAKRLSRKGDTLHEPDDPSRPQTNFFYPPLAIDFKKCNDCGNCTIGCQEGAKNTLDRNYLKELRDVNGFELRTLCEVLYIKLCKDDAPAERFEVVYYDHLTKREGQVKTKYVFLGAGAVGTTEILFRSKTHLLPNRGSVTGLDHLGKRFFANGDNLGVAFDIDEYGAPSQGPTITSTVLHVEDEHAPGAAPLWFLLQDGGVPAHLDALLGLFRSPIWLARNRLTEARRRDLSWLRSRRELGDRAIADFELLIGDFANALVKQRKRVFSEERRVPREWVAFLPESIQRIATFFRGLSDNATDQVRRFDDRVLDKIARDTLWLSKLAVDPDRLVRHIGDVVAELYPPLRPLLREGMGFEALIEIARFLVLGSTPSQRTFVMLAMGPDPSGTLSFDARERLRVAWKWDESPSAKLFSLQERLMRDFAAELGGELRTNPDWTLGRRAVTVHSQGGCGMSSQLLGGVTDPHGRVYGFAGLYVVDAAAFPSSVGANPSCTIAAVAELKAEHFAEHVLGRQRLAGAAQPARRLNIDQPSAPIRSEPLGITWTEELRGWLKDEPNQSELEERWHSQRLTFTPQFEALERRSGDATPLRVHLDIRLPDIDVFVRSFEQCTDLPKANFTGHWSERGERPPHAVTGEIRFLAKSERVRRRQRKLVLTGLEYRMHVDRRGEYVGVKVFHDDPGFDLWSDLTTLYVADTARGSKAAIRRAGFLRVTTRDFLTIQLPSYNALSQPEHEHQVRERAREAARQGRTSLAPPAADPPVAPDPEAARYVADPAARAWALTRFGWLMYRGLVDEYRR